MLMCLDGNNLKDNYWTIPLNLKEEKFSLLNLKKS